MNENTEGSPVFLDGANGVNVFFSLRSIPKLWKPDIVNHLFQIILHQILNRNLLDMDCMEKE
nr:MAG TPA: hypothetical protein [Caudoviricetes sp.]